MRFQLTQPVLSHRGFLESNPLQQLTPYQPASRAPAWGPAGDPENPSTPPPLVASLKPDRQGNNHCHCGSGWGGDKEISGFCLRNSETWMLPHLDSGGS